MRKLIIIFSVFFVFCAHSSFASYKGFKLKNGLKVYIEENHTLPIVNVTILYKVGCIDEYNSITGISHMLEHMNFRGSKHFKDGFIDKLSTEFGGIDNAQTAFDYTVYFTTINKKALKEVLSFYADNMNNLLLLKKRFLKERSVVYQERLWRIDNSADGFLYYMLHNLAYLASPYRWTPIGYSYDIRHYSIKDLRKYYKKYYAPNNAVLVISGDINTKDAFILAKSSFSDKKPINITRNITKEPNQTGRKVAYIKKPSSFKKIAIGFKIPLAKNRDSYALDLISYMLFYGKTALMDKNLVKDKNIFAFISGGNEGRMYDKGLFEIFGDIKNSISFDEARKYIIAELNNIKKGKFSDEIFKTAKAKALSDYFFSKENLSSNNKNIALYAAFNMLDYYENYPKNIKTVTKKEVEAVANEYFKESRESDCFLIPSEGKVVNGNFKGVLR